MSKGKKRGRPRLSASPMVLKGVLLPPELLDQLRIDAKVNGRSVCAEMRERLIASYHGKPPYAQTDFARTTG